MGICGRASIPCLCHRHSSRLETKHAAASSREKEGETRGEIAPGRPHHHLTQLQDGSRKEARRSRKAKAKLAAKAAMCVEAIIKPKIAPRNSKAKVVRWLKLRKVEAHSRNNSSSNSKFQAKRKEKRVNLTL